MKKPRCAVQPSPSSVSAAAMRWAIAAYSGRTASQTLAEASARARFSAGKRCFFALVDVGQFGADLVRSRLLSIDLAERPRRRALEWHQVGNQLARRRGGSRRALPRGGPARRRVRR